MGTLSGFLVGDTPVMAQDLEYRIDAMTSRETRSEPILTQNPTYSTVK